MLQIRKGSGEVALFATGSMVKTAMAIAQNGLDADIWSVPAIKPIDTEQIKMIAIGLNRIVTLEEHSVMGGLGSTISELIGLENPMPICRVGIEDKFSNSCGSWDHLLQEHGLDLATVTDKIQRFLAS